MSIIIGGTAMRVSAEQAAENRRRVVQEASALYRRHGIGGIGLAGIMREAGLSHGGFYGKFDSKDALAAEACRASLLAAAEDWQRVADREGASGLARIAARYRAMAGRADAATLCTLAALAGEAAREGAEVRGAFAEGVRALAAALARMVPGRGPTARRRAALATLAQLVGGVVLARAVADPALAREIMEAASSL